MMVETDRKVLIERLDAEQCSCVIYNGERPGCSGAGCTGFIPVVEDGTFSSGVRLSRIK